MSCNSIDHNRKGQSIKKDGKCNGSIVAITFWETC